MTFDMMIEINAETGMHLAAALTLQLKPDLQHLEEGIVKIFALRRSVGEALGLLGVADSQPELVLRVHVLTSEEKTVPALTTMSFMPSPN